MLNKLSGAKAAPIQQVACPTVSDDSELARKYIMNTTYRTEAEEMSKKEPKYPWISFFKARLKQHKWMHIVFGVAIANVVAGFIVNHFSSEENAGMIPFVYTMRAFIAYMFYGLIVHLCIYMTSNPEESIISDEYRKRSSSISKKFKVPDV